MYKKFLLTPLFAAAAAIAFAQSSPDRVDRMTQQGQQAIARAQALVAVFQPLLLKAQELYGQGKALVQGAKNIRPGDGQPAYGTGGAQPGYPASGGTQPSYPAGGTAPAYPGGSGTQPAYPSGGTTGSGTSPAYPGGSTSGSNGTQPNNGSPNGAPPAYGNPTGNGVSPAYGASGSGTGGAQPAPEFYLPVNNPGSVNNDGSGNWGNQNNGLYGNCLDALTGTVLGMGEAADKPSSIDLLFFAPADGQNTYYIMTPGFARNNSTATYMTQHTSDQVLQWKDVNESEVALTRLTIGQFDQIKNNSQISGAVRNAQNYSGYYSSVGQKLDGQVLAVKVQMDDRQVYALVAIDRQIGTSGGNGYLKIRIKAQGLDGNNNGIPDANNYIR